MGRQLSLFDEPKPLKIKGLMDDGFCPVCGYSFDELVELDLNRCPNCLTRVDWSTWHLLNDRTEVQQS